MPKAPNTHLIAAQPLAVRLMERRVITEPGCWEWQGALTQHGYGRMSWRDRIYRTHRLAAHLWLGLPLEESTVKVCHHCDNPPCFNPEHLYLGDQKSNVADMVARGRNYPGPQPWSHCSKGHALTPETTVGRVKPRCRECNNTGQRRRRERKSVRAIREHIDINN